MVHSANEYVYILHCTDEKAMMVCERQKERVWIVFIVFEADAQSAIKQETQDREM